MSPPRDVGGGQWDPPAEIELRSIVLLFIIIIYYYPEGKINCLGCDYHAPIPTWGGGLLLKYTIMELVAV